MIQFFKRLFEKSETYDVFDIYTPTKPATFTFIERQNINSRLISAIKTPGKVVVVYGHSGSGKSTLILNKLKEKYSSFIISRCSSDTTFNELLLDAFHQMDSFFLKKISDKESDKLSTGIGGNVLGLDAEINNDFSAEKTQEFEKIVPYQINEQDLAKKIKAINCCWIIEDFHKVSNKEKKILSDCLKIFFDEEAKVITIGAVGTARKVVQHNKEMRNRVSEILVTLMTDEELLKIIQKGEKLLNIKITESVKTKIVKFSSGLASVCHQLCLNICIEKNVLKTSSNTIKISEKCFLKGLNRYIFDISDSLKDVFDKATSFTFKEDEDFGKELIKSILSLELDEFSEKTIIKEFEKGKRESIRRVYACQKLIKRFTTSNGGEILRYDKNSNKYSFSDPFFVAYCHCLFGKEMNLDGNPNIILGSSNNIRGDFNIRDSNIVIGDIIINQKNKKDSKDTP